MCGATVGPPEEAELVVEKFQLSIKMKEQQSKAVYDHFSFVLGKLQKNPDAVFLSLFSRRRQEQKYEPCVTYVQHPRC